jgi:hypothetical protein
MRRAFALLGLFAAALVAWLGLLPSQAMATVEGGCTARIGGVNVTRGHDSADTAVPLESGRRVPIAGTAPERIGDLSYTVHVAGGGVQVGSVTISQDGLSWAGDVDLENIANATVGLFEVTAEVQNVSGQEICTGVAFVCVEGRSPFTTAAGATATALGVGGGILLVLALVRAPGMGVARTGVQGFGGGAAAGLGGAVLLQQFCLVPLTAATAAGVPIAIGAAGAIGASVLRSTGTRAARRAAQLAHGHAGGGGGPAGEPSEVLERAGTGSGGSGGGGAGGAGGPSASAGPSPAPGAPSGPAGGGPSPAPATPLDAPAGGGPSPAPGAPSGPAGGGPTPAPGAPSGGPPGGGPSPAPGAPSPGGGPSPAPGTPGTGGPSPAPGGPAPSPPADGGVIVPPVVPPKDDELVCANCGTANSADNQFCTNCGSRLGS